MQLAFAGTIDLDEFTNVWLKFCDLRHELERRGVEVPGWATKAQLRKILRQQLDADADKERKAMAEARRWRQWQVRACKPCQQLREGVNFVRLFRSLACCAGSCFWWCILVLERSLECASRGHCSLVRKPGLRCSFGMHWMVPARCTCLAQAHLGSSTLRCQHTTCRLQATSKTGTTLSGVCCMIFASQKFANRITSIHTRCCCRIWRERLRPELVFARMGQDFKNNEPPPELKKGIEYEEAKASHFSGLTVADNTVSLWGR